MSNANQIRVVLFVNDPIERVGQPNLSGKVTFEDGSEKTIELWKENANTKAGYLYKGRLVDPYKKSQD